MAAVDTAGPLRKHADVEITYEGNARNSLARIRGRRLIGCRVGIAVALVAV